MQGAINDQHLSALCGLSRHKNVKVKISAYYALGKKSPPHHELVPMIRRLFEAYGSDRLIGPVIARISWVTATRIEIRFPLVRDHIDFVTPAERTALLSNNSRENVFLCLGCSWF